MDLSQTSLELHRDAQEEYTRRYGGAPGPIIPVHTRNDVENIALCGEEDFLRFSWWRRYRDFGQVTGFWHFNGALTDASGIHTCLAGGAPHLCRVSVSRGPCGRPGRQPLPDPNGADLNLGRRIFTSRWSSNPGP
jgi:hypothetical protein